jgi:DNA-binding GntR family transcriptional regulator
VVDYSTAEADADGSSRTGASGAGLTGAQRAVAALREGIRTGRYVPGQRLVEADLTRDLGVGRNSLREAFSRLSSEGLILMEPHRGASIRRRTREEIAQLYDLSEVLEGLAAREAATHIAMSGNAELLSSATDRLRTARQGSTNQQIEEAARFHQSILRIAGSPRLTELVDDLHIQTFSFQLRHAHRAGLDSSFSDRSLAEHLAVADAIAQGDPVTAENVMREHLRSGKQRLLALPNTYFA